MKRLWHRLLISSGFIMACLGFTMWLFAVSFEPVVAQSLATPAPPDLAPVVNGPQNSLEFLEPVLDPPILVAGGEGELRLGVRGLSLPTCFGAPQKPLDAVVVIDSSPSAGSPEEGSNLWQSKLILKSLWAQMNQPVCKEADDANCQPSRLGIITVDIGQKGAVVNARLPLTYTTEAINQTIEQLPNGADSAFDLAIEEAEKLLKKQARDDAAKAIVLLFHDKFFASEETVIATAQEVGRRYPLYIIGNTLNLREEEALTEAIAAQLSSSERVFMNPSAEDLRRLFVFATGGTTETAGRAILLRAIFSPADLISLWPQNRGDVQGSRVVWRIDTIPTGETKRVSTLLRVSSQAVGTPIRYDTDIAYIDCNGFINRNGGVKENVPVAQEPTPTAESSHPTETPPPAATPTPHIVPTLTQEPSSSHLPKIRLNLKLILWLIPILIIPLVLYGICRLLGKCGKAQPSDKGRNGPPPPVNGDNGDINGTSPETPEPAGETITPGVVSEDETFRDHLSQDLVIRCKIPSQQSGAHRSKTSIAVFETMQDLKAIGGLDAVLARTASAGRGEVILLGEDWQDELARGTATVLREILQQRVSPKAPLIAFWTEEATDGAILDVRTKTDRARKQIRIQGRSRHRNLSESRAFYLYLKFLTKPEGFAISLDPLLEN